MFNSHNCSKKRNTQSFISEKWKVNNVCVFLNTMLFRIDNNTINYRNNCEDKIELKL
eukprot:m.11887 g.11887  ORF g.11887 m.11887 type:complete len:57 (+) comp7069_c0_seq2:640-810(+)